MNRLLPIVGALGLMAGALPGGASAQGTEGAATSPTELDRIVAVVDDDVILHSEMDQAVRTVVAQIRQQKVALPPANIIERQVLERLILQRIQLQLAARSGIRVDDDTLNSAIRNIAQRNKLSLGEFRAILERDGYDFERFREDIRNQLIIARLHQREVTNRITVTDQEVEDFLASRRAQGGAEAGEWQLAQILIAVPEGASPAQIQAAREKAQSVLAKLRQGADFEETAVSVSEGQNALEGGVIGWRKAGEIPTLFAPLVPKMKPGDISDLIRSPSGFHILKVVDYRGGHGSQVLQTRARHILIHTNDLTSDDEAKTRLEHLRMRIQGGDDFSELARANSDDTASASNGGNLGWISPGDVVPEFEQAMSSLSPGEVSAPFKTPFGWHIVQVLERRRQSNGAETQRAAAADAIRQRKSEEELEAWLRRLRDETYVEIRLEPEGGRG